MRIYLYTVTQVSAYDCTFCTELENAFQVNHSDKSFHVVAQSRADKVNWLSNLQKQIKKITEGWFNSAAGPCSHTHTHTSPPSAGNNDTQVLLKAVWVPDSVCKECSLCNQKFTAFVRKVVNVISDVVAHPDMSPHYSITVVCVGG